MQPQNTEALEAAAWRDFSQRLGAQLADHWPAMSERLGERYGAFIELAIEQAGKQGLSLAAGVARYVNLCFVWGPNFQNKPGYDWALNLLGAPDRNEWLTVHQLVQRSVKELQLLTGALIKPELLAQTDAALLDSFGQLGPRGSLLRRDPDTPALACKACDLQKVDLRCLMEPPQQEYFLANEGWQRRVVRPTANIRVDADHVAPKIINVLAAQNGQSGHTQLQLRTLAHASCAEEVHPALGFSGPHGRWDWIGHETSSVTWPVATRDQPLPKAGPGSFIAEETSPELYRLDLDVCGLRDSGQVAGGLQSIVSAWPSAQWWIEVQRSKPAMRDLLPAPSPGAAGLTRCRVERDGVAQDSRPLQMQFDTGLDGAVDAGLQRLAAAWQQSAGLSMISCQARLGLLLGEMACTWGWQLGPGGLADPALMRLVAAFDMQACITELRLGGELTLLDSRSLIELRCSGQALLRQQVQHDQTLPPLADALLPVRAAWEFPFELSLEPLTTETGCLLQQVGPLTGGLIGEAGLRPCTKGGSGWEWFAGLRIEPVTAMLQLSDPLLGHRVLKLPLLPAMPLLDWSLG